MWFYVKYIVKKHSDRILLARLCSYFTTGISTLVYGTITYLHIFYNHI